MTLPVTGSTKSIGVAPTALTDKEKNCSLDCTLFVEETEDFALSMIFDRRSLSFAEKQTKQSSL